MASDASSISVCVRVRPFTIREAAQLTKTDDSPLFLGDGSLAAVPNPRLASKGIRPVIKVVDEKCLVFDPPEDNPVQRFSRSVVPQQGKRVKDQTFGFDRVFDENTSQEDVYESTTKPLLDSVLDGYNATVFAYGATGCGKTHTITGTVQQPGIIFLTMQELFDRMDGLKEEKIIEISLSYLEIYNEMIRDLLVPGGSKQSLMLREDANQAVSVANLSSHCPKSVNEVMEMIVRGNEYRTMSPTEANATSSRSHAVLQINLAIKDRNADISEPHTMATLSIIDLAGSERASATKNLGARLLEGANINKSLLALGSCINALCDPRKKNHVPYRNSKLTRLLKFSLGGNCKTVMIVCVSPSSAHFDETQNTLRYANRAKNIQTKVTRNVYNVNRHVKDFLKKIDEQMALINELKAQQKDFEAVAFAKFRKQVEKQEQIAREGVARIRAAYDHSATERQERSSMMKKLRLIERRISLISAWIAGFDTICEARDEEEPSPGLVTMRKTAKGILTELESSRQHYHQRLAKNNWERALDTALQTGIRQLKDAEGGESSDVANLIREAELLKSIADREAYTGLLDQEKGGDAAVVQVLLQAHFDTIAILGQIVQMSEDDAVQAAKKMITQLITNCSTATAQVIKPDGGLTITEMFPPRRSGTPKQRKTASLLGPSVLPAITQPNFVENIPMIDSTPVLSSPRRGAVFLKGSAARKNVRIGTPKRKSPTKMAKGGVRWRDETDNQTLADYQATPQALQLTPEVSSIDSIPPQPQLLPNVSQSTKEGSSPIPTPPEASTDVRPRSSRFQTGFLSKKTDGSPHAAAPLAASNLNFSSDSDNSPLREMELNRAPRLSPLGHANTNSSDVTPADSAGSSGSEDESSKSHWPIGKVEQQKVRSALKRSSSTATGSAMRTQRRRSPTATSAGSPPSENMFSAGQARRMGNNSVDAGWKHSVLSPRSAPVAKVGPVRRTTMSTTEIREGSGSIRSGPVRMSTATAGGSVGRSSMMNNKGTWR